MKVKIISIVLAFALFFSVSAPSVYAAQSVDANGFTQESADMVVSAPPLDTQGELKDNHLVTFMDANQVILATSVPHSAPVTVIPPTGKENKVLVGWFSDAAFTTPFYAETPVTQNLTVYAKYEDAATILDTEEETPTYFSVEDVKSDYTFTIKVPTGTVLADIEKNVSATSEVQSAGVKLVFTLQNTTDGKDVYVVNAQDGYRLSSSYEIMLLDESYVFVNTADGTDHAATVRQINIITESGENQNKLMYAEEVGFLHTSEISNFVINEDSQATVDTFDAPVLTVDEQGNQGTPEKRTGSFTYSGTQSFEVDQIVSLYPDTDPREDINAQASFVKIVSVAGDTVNFRTLESSDANKIFKLPSSILIYIDETATPAQTFPTITNNAGSISIDVGITTIDGADYMVDSDLYEIAKAATADQSAKDAIKIPSKISANDILVFVNKKNATIGQEDDVEYMYGVVREVTTGTGTGVYNVIFDKKETINEVQESINTYNDEQLPYSVLKKDIDEAEILQQVEQQAMSSGFVESATQDMVEQVLTSENFFEQVDLPTEELYDENGNKRSTDEILMMAGYGPTPLIMPPVIEFDIGESHEAFYDGVRVSMNVKLTITIEPGMMDTTRKTLQIDIESNFVQEFSFGIDASGYVAIVPIPIPPPLSVVWIPTPVAMDLSVSVEVKTYTNAQLFVNMYSIKENAGLAVKQLKKISRQPLGDLKPYAMKIGRLQGYYDMYLLARDIGDPNARELYDEAKKLYAELQEEYVYTPTDRNDPDDIDFKNISFDTFIESEIYISQSPELLNSITTETSPTAAKQKTNELIESYSQLLEGSESEWMELVKIGLFGPNGLGYQLSVIDIKFQASIVISADILISLSSEMTYQFGKRYTFWMKWNPIHGIDTGSSEVDLLDEHFAYSFSIMGYIGLRLGLELSFKVGLVSVYFASVGIVGEIGAYAKLYGYFVYAFDQLRRMGKTEAEISESMMGALFLDVGVYAEVDFVAALLDSAITHEQRLFEYEDSKLTAGIRNNVYDFTFAMKSDEKLNLIDEVGNDGDISMDLPEILRTMKVLDLKTGELSHEVFDASDFNFISTNENFKVDANGRVTITPPDDRIRYMEADIQLVWKGQPLSFSNYAIASTIPVVWNNLSSEELQTPRTVKVNAVDDAGAQTTVWSDLVYASELFYLPSEADILGMLNYDSFSITNTDTGAITNLKYEDIVGYTRDNTGKATDESAGQLILSDTTYYFEMDVRDYSLTVNDVIGVPGNAVTLTAKFGETFELPSALINSGYNGEVVESKASYSQFSGISSTRQEGKEYIEDRDFSKPLDISFGKEILDAETVYSAKYEDTAVSVTYQFVGRISEPITKIYEMGTIPNFSSDIGGLTYTDAQGVVHYFESVTPNVSAVNADTIYTVSYTIDTPDATKYKINYYTNDFTTPSQTVEFAMNTNIFSIPNPTMVGGTFLGWYTDTALTTPFTGFTPDPTSGATMQITGDINLYAKFDTVMYDVTYDANLVGVEDPTTGKVAFGATYGTLPVVSDANQKFLGWYTTTTDAPIAGTEILATSVHDV